MSLLVASIDIFQDLVVALVTSYELAFSQKNVQASAQHFGASSRPIGERLRKTNQLPLAREMGLVVKESESRGCVLVADKDFGLGETVIEEQPAIFAPNRDIFTRMLEVLQNEPDLANSLDFFQSVKAADSHKYPELQNNVELMNSVIPNLEP
eukprot:gene2131-18178_t